MVQAASVRADTGLSVRRTVAAVFQISTIQSMFESVGAAKVPSTSQLTRDGLLPPLWFSAKESQTGFATRDFRTYSRTGHGRIRCTGELARLELAVVSQKRRDMEEKKRK